MQYLVIGPDGTEYGPADVPTLQTWATDNRLRPDSQLRDFNSGMVTTAGQVPGIFAAPNSIPPSNPYAYATPASANAYGRPTTIRNADDMSAVWGSVLRSVAAIAFFFLLHGIGLVFAVYAVIYGVQAKSSGNKYGTIALVISIVALVVVVIGWVLRLNGGGV
jgi:hypothetical protein